MGSGHGSEEGSRWGAGPQLVSLRVLEGGCWWVLGKLADQIKDMQCGSREAVLRSDRLLGASESLSFPWWRLFELTSIPPGGKCRREAQRGPPGRLAVRTGFWGKLHSLGRVLGALVSQLPGIGASCRSRSPSQLSLLGSSTCSQRPQQRVSSYSRQGLALGTINLQHEGHEFPWYD